MTSLFLRKVAGLDLEEKILNIAVICSLFGMFFPWIEGRWLGNELRTHTGFGFYTSFIGLTVFALNAYILAMTLVPLTSGNQLLSKERKEQVRFYCSAAATVLLLGALSVLTKITFDFQGMEVRFGMYLTLFGSIATSLYAYLTLQEKKRNRVKELFHQAEPEPVITRNDTEELQNEPTVEQEVPSEPEPEPEYAHAIYDEPTEQAPAEPIIPPPPEAEDHRLHR